MSLILLGLSTLEENKGQVPICSLDIRNETCGGNFNCHFQPQVDQILKGFGLEANEEVKESFAMPNKWFCSEFTLFSLWHMKEKEKQQNDSDNPELEMFFERQQDLAVHKNKTNKLTYDIDSETLEQEIGSKYSIADMFEHLENRNFRCYYSLAKPYTSEGQAQPDGFEMMICYQESSGNLEPNESFKVIFDIIYYLDGRVEISEWMISEDEEKTFQKIVDFDPDK